jgi:uncharacterized membrane protein YqjE
MMSLGQGFRSLAAGYALAARQRLELAALDVEDEMQHAGRMLAGMLAVAFFLALALAALGAAVVIAFWDGARLAAALGVTAAYTIGAVLAWQRLVRAWAAKPPFLDATITELRKDAGHLAGTP